MKNILLATVLGLSFLGLKAQQKDKYQTVEIQTSAICEMCQYAIEKEMALEKGVKSSSLNLDNKVLTVKYNSKKTDSDKVRKRVSLTGYHADDVERDPVAYENLPLCCKDGAHSDDN
ncbi:MAG: heavy metal-associated domain-containing protein [Cyclobacteriaceae bacterium]